jgi:peptide chain release factor 2
MDIRKDIENLEKEMAEPLFWDNKERAQEKIKALSDLKKKISEEEVLYKGSAIITIFSGAGGDDAEDWARMLFDMYQKYCEKKGFGLLLLHEHYNDHNGIKNITFEVSGKGVYGLLRNESGVHRLVRVSPFSAKKLRHTSFAMVEVIPKFEKGSFIVLELADLDIQFAKSGGPGGQNVNKRETAVRVVHKPTGISVHASSERSQSANKERALEILKGKLFRMKEALHKEKRESFQVSKIQDAEWGNQIRSYVLHPYKMVKDHRTNIEHKSPDRVLSGEDLDLFLEAEQNIEVI